MRWGTTASHANDKPTLPHCSDNAWLAAEEAAAAWLAEEEAAEASGPHDTRQSAH